MRIRTQLIVAFLLLAVLPLSGIVLFSYINSKNALEEATEAEADARNQDMQNRMASLRQTLGRQTEELGGQLLRYLRRDQADLAEVDEMGELAKAIEGLGEGANMIEGIVFVPEKPPGPPGAPDPEGFPHDIPSEGAFFDLNGESLEIDVPEMIRAIRVEAIRELAKDQETPAWAKKGLDLGLGWLANTIERQAALEDDVVEIPVGDPAQENPAPRDPVSSDPASSDPVSSDPVSSGPASSGPASSALASSEPAASVLREPGGHVLKPPRPPRSPGSPPRSRTPRTVQAMSEDSMTLVSMEQELEQDGRIVGRITPRINARAMVRHVLHHTDRDRGEIPFAIDKKGRLFVSADEDEALLDDLGLAERLTAEGVLDRPPSAEVLKLAAPPADQERSFRIGDDWVVVTTVDPASGLILGIASPLGDSLDHLRTTTFRNLLVGLILIALAVFGILPISRRMTRHLDQVTVGAERIAGGDLGVRLPETSNDEFGQLARVFNRMTTDLDRQQRELLEQQRQRRAQEIEQRLLEAELQRKSEELEEARRFQLSMLPKTLPDSDFFDIAVEMRTATEVGGDYYDFASTEDGLTIAIGDATGHGATAGRMVTVIKSLFSSWAGRGGLATFLADIQRAVKRMDLGRMAMALALVRLERRGLIVTSAGMPPILIARQSSGRVEEVAVAGMPLGGLDDSFTERHVDLESGDLVVLMSDGLPELANADGDPLGYEAVRQHLERHAKDDRCSPQEVIDDLWRVVEEWTGGEPPGDDVTFVVLRVR